jgi:hypothetical protein
VFPAIASTLDRLGCIWERQSIEFMPAIIMAEEHKVILKNIEDWKDWISTMQMTAQGLGIWEFINPDIEPDKIPRLRQAEKPSGTADAGDLEMFKYRMKEWSEQRSAMTKMPKEIIQTVDKSWVLFINDYSSPYTMLRDLRARMKPDDDVYQDLLLKKWRKLQPSIPSYGPNDLFYYLPTSHWPRKLPITQFVGAMSAYGRVGSSFTTSAQIKIMQ